MKATESYRVASVPLRGGEDEAVVCVQGYQVQVYMRLGHMTPREARMLAAALVAASREAEDS